MSSPDPVTASPSLLRTGAKAGAAFVASAFLGVVLAIVLGGGVFFYYISRLSGPGMPAAAHTGGAGAILALFFSPPLLVSMLLLAFVPIYATLGIARGRSRAVEQVVNAHGQGLAQRLSGVIAGRIETMPRAQGALHRVSDVMSPEAIVQQIAPVAGQGRAVRAVVKVLVNRLPLADLMAEWQQARAANPAAAAAPGGPDPVLRNLLAIRIGDTLRNASASSRKPFYIAMAIHAVLLGVGIYLTS